MLLTTVSCVNKHACFSVTYISSWLLQVLIIHIIRDDLCGLKTGGVRLRQLPLKIRLDEMQLPAGDKKQQLSGSDTRTQISVYVRIWHENCNLGLKIIYV